MENANRFLWPVRPVAVQGNIFQGANYRFTVLTPCLIRMEYSASGIFEDRASQSVFYRDFPQNVFSVSRRDGNVVLDTSCLRLHYRENKPFAEDTLSVQLKIEPASTWHFGEDFEDLGGTTKTLDTVDGTIPLERGVVSRNGFSVLDDSHTLVLEEDGWVGLRQENTVDCYFFGFGFDYLGAVQALYALTGVPPMLPAYALGNWWSRYHAYTQQEYIDLMERFKAEDMPFSVGVVDMDWHIVNIPEEQKDTDTNEWKWCNVRDGWTGYSWNKELFPDYKAFLKYLKDNHLHTSLNLHPHAGTRRHEDMYEAMAKASGIDPASGKRVPLDILSKAHMANYFDILHHPYEDDGVDFWWMDWQQGTDYWWIHEPNAPGKYHDERERMDPLWMLNHLHILDISRNGKRPMFFSRYAGPGSQRYPVGFSGDSFVSWDSLDFQPYFTATASNIGYCWWSHDIGGHMGGCRDDELSVRWLQFGVFSPINRLHSSMSNFQRKEPWNYGYEESAVMKDWLRLRHAMFPYLYTMNYRTHTQRIPLMQPMYYSHPKCQAAYEVPNQYWFGSELVVAPITRKMDANSRMGKVKAWLPKGEWFDFFTGLHYAGLRGRKMNLHRDLHSIPVLAKAGAIVPMARYEKHDNRLLNGENMELLVFPGGDNVFTLYEDAGDYSDYRDGAFAQTRMELTWGEEAALVIQPAQGELSLIPETRNWKVCLRGFHKDVRVSVSVPGAAVRRNAETNTTEVTFTASVTEQVTIIVTGTTLIHDNADALDRCEYILQRSQICNGEKDFIMSHLRAEDSLHGKLYNITARAKETAQVVDAVRELMTLTEDEYLGK